MGTDVKLLTAACQLFSTSCKYLNFPHRPLVVAVISGNRVLLLVLAVGTFIPAPLCSGNYVRTSLRTPTLHYAFIHASTSTLHGISIPFFTPYIPFLQSYPCHFPPISIGCLHSCGELTPIRESFRF